MAANEYVALYNDGYYVADTRVGLDVVTRDFRNGRSPEAILQAYPSIGSLARVYGAIAFILDNPAEVEAYLQDQDRILQQLQTRHPMPPDVSEQLSRAINHQAPTSV